MGAVEIDGTSDDAASAVNLGRKEDLNEDLN